MPYSIMVREYGSDHDVELCRVKGNPEPTIAGLRAKTLTVQLGGSVKKSKIPKYSRVDAIEVAT